MDTTELVSGNTAFALELYAHLARANGNIAISPFSVSSALAMTWSGARGETAEEMRAVLHLPGARAHAGFATLVDSITTDRPMVELAVANGLFINAKVQLLDGFKEITRDQYFANTESLDFGQPQAVVEHINRWISEQTRERINDCLSEQEPPSQIVLVNAVAFKGAWRRPFDKRATTPQAFFAPSGAETVPMMMQSLQTRYGALPSMTAVELQFSDGSDLALLVLLPNARDGLAALEQRLTPALLHEVNASLETSDVVVALPRFTIDARYPLEETLPAMGMTKAIKGPADFSAMMTAPLRIGRVTHRVFIEVNEEGAEAAAATVIETTITAKQRHPKSFRADHPFLFALRDLRSGTLLFLGRVENPAPRERR
ncbi:MAG: serpin family protein [Myxococcaceae bacterium]|nr:serpin family protein [Myxococcaceae bacterium]